jgi:DNA mismatch endonuclease (patch repair protein)
MPDIVTPEVRSRMMAGIRSRNTKPEMILRHGLHAVGFRYRLHDRALPGRPDMVFSRYRAVLFAHGCFWHGHDCHLFQWPASRHEFWNAKITRNREVDARSELALADAGWRIGVVWECALKGRTRLPVLTVLESCTRWLRSDEPRLELRGVAGSAKRDAAIA